MTRRSDVTGGTDGGAGRRSRPVAAVRRRPRPVLTACAAILLVACGAVLQSWRDREAAAPASDDDAWPGRPLTVARSTALSFSAVLADLYWIRAVQHYGRTRLAGGGAQDYGRLYPLLDVATTLDPRFEAAYRLGAVFLAEPPPGGPGRPDLALALLRKGLRNAPDNWKYLQDIGFVHYWWLRDVKGAAEWFGRAAARPDAPRWLRPLAAAAMVEGGDRAGARVLWRQVHDSTDDAWLRGEATRRLAQLDVLDALDGLQRVVDGFHARTGRSPESWRELVAVGDLPARPVDPTGVPYALTTPRGEVALSPHSVLFPLPGGVLSDRQS